VLGGLFEFTDDTWREAEFGAQYRLGRHLGAFGTMAGGMVTSAGDFHLYAGLALEIPASRRVLLRLAFAPGYYDRGAQGKDLGYALEFRSSFEIGWCLRTGWRLGLELVHVSNAGLGRVNPGSGSLLLVVTRPFGGQ
jgi:lipid A 3-O-deacylase